MTTKQRLDLDALVVESFATTRGPVGPRGTVRGHDADAQPQPTPPEVEAACTCAASCLCPTNAFYCATAPATAVSCDYTANASCVYDTFSNAPPDSVEICEFSPKCLTDATCGGISCNICTE